MLLPSSLSILVVDADAVHRRAVVAALAEAQVDAKVEEAEDSASAIVALGRRSFDCVLIDYELAGDALEVISAVKESVDAPFIVLTEQIDAAIASELLSHGATDWLPKNRVSPEHLAHSIRHALRLRRAERRERDAEAALARQRAQLARLALASPRIHTALTLEDTIDVVGREARELLGAAMAVTRIDLGAVVQVTMAKELEAKLDATARQEIHDLAGRLTTPSTLRSIAKNELSSAPEVLELCAAIARHVQLDGWITAPLTTRAGPVGSLHLAAPSGGFGEADVNLLIDLASTASIALENARLYRAAKQATQARDDVLAIVAHDLRGPLNNVALSASLLGEDLEGHGQDFSAEQKLVDGIRRNVARMNRLIEDLLEAARVESGQIVVTMRPERADALVVEAIDLASAAAEAKRSNLARGPLDGDAMVLADRDRVLQLMGNLLGNAIKFTPPGGTIRVSLERVDERAVITVSDTGPGIEASHLPKIFERFQKGRKDGTRDGAGLGLFIARGIVEAHGGTIAIQSASGDGTTVRFSLPLVDQLPSVL